MKNRNIVSIILISLAYLSPIFTTIYFRDKLNIDGSDPFSAIIIVSYGIYIFKYFKSLFNSQVFENQAATNRLKIIWAIFFLSISGFIYYYAYYYEPNMGYNPVLILFGIFMMIDGNYQSVILPKNVAFESRMGEGYEESVYKKSLRLRGRFQFYFGLIISVIFLILPNTPQTLLFGIGGILFTYYLGSWWVIYKNTQIIAKSEARPK